MLSYVLGLNTDWNHTLIMIDGVDLVRKSSSAMNVFPFAFRDDMPLLSCFVSANIVSKCRPWLS